MMISMSTTGTDNTPCCLLCGSAARSEFVKFNKEFYTCPTCGLGFIHPPPEPDDIIKLYDQSYYDPWGIGGADNATERMKKATFHDKLDAIERFVPAKGRILDIGCATGFFLDAARERGWEVYGVELSAYSSTIARNKLGNDRIITGTVEEAGYENGSFDVVVMTDVIEHVVNVQSFVKEVARILKPNGVTAITTPDPLSLSCRMLGQLWPHYKLEHLVYFTPRALSVLLEPSGFKRLYLAAATKTLTFAYLSLQLRTYPIPLLTPITRLLSKLLPEALQQRNFRIYSGELFDISRLEKGVVP
jgi:2-polyprenyl-3-methyl-5-hydroxy-6-metoxy-1,4-benzoquinol methylase